MGIYIKGMEMPRNCGTCRFKYFKKDECSWYSCSLLPSDTDEGSNGADIQDNCPLVKVPEPHGKLIDENDVIEAIYERLKELQIHPVFKKKHGDIDLIGVIPYIEKIKTVIEAENE